MEGVYDSKLLSCKGWLVDSYMKVERPYLVIYKKLLHACKYG